MTGSFDMGSLDSYLKSLFQQGGSTGSTGSTGGTGTGGSTPSTGSGQQWYDRLKSMFPNATWTAPKTGSTSGSTSSVPSGFTSSQWRMLQSMAKTNPTIAALIKQYTSSTTGGSTTPPADAWRRQMPTDTSQLLRQLSFNVGEMGMPGGYVGAVQIPSYGSGAAPINNPDMSTYGQAPGVGEATFYQQSMKGGMTPISAMSPLGVPQGWNPGGTTGSSSSTTKSQLEAYLTNLGSGGSLSSIFGGLFGGLSGGTKSRSPLGSWLSDFFDKYEKTQQPSTGTATPTPAASLPPPTGGTPITPPYGTTP